MADTEAVALLLHPRRNGGTDADALRFADWITDVADAVETVDDPVRPRPDEIVQNLRLRDGLPICLQILRESGHLDIRIRDMSDMTADDLLLRDPTPESDPGAFNLDADGPACAGHLRKWAQVLRIVPSAADGAPMRTESIRKACDAAAEAIRSTCGAVTREFRITPGGTGRKSALHMLPSSVPTDPETVASIVSALDAALPGAPMLVHDNPSGCYSWTFATDPARWYVTEGVDDPVTALRAMADLGEMANRQPDGGIAWTSLN